VKPELEPGKERRLKIAVVGSGIAGLGAAWLLAKRHDVTVIERADRLGGHSHTVDVVDGGAACPVDMGFIVYNTASYPNLIALFDTLDVATAPTNMSFAVSRNNGAYEYSGSGFGGVFGQRRNLANPRHWRMVSDILRFFRAAPAVLNGPDLTLGNYLAAHRYSDAFIEDHILPMAAAIWSMPKTQALEFPAKAFVRFFANHGLLQARNRPEWRTVAGGSRTYVDAIRATLPGGVRTGSGVAAVTRSDMGCTVIDGKGAQNLFDHVVIAAHADDALALLTDASADERRLLGAFRYTANRAVLHDDPRFMPKRRAVWASWNYLDKGRDDTAAPSVTYWMNRLQPLGISRDLFVSLNPAEALKRERILATFDATHPVFDSTAIAAQRQLWSLQGQRNTWFCGAHFGYGFHEDGLQAGLAVAEQLGGLMRPWQVAEPSGRIHVMERAA
jgi:uncharacterized protein